jgi:hypothetical protein
VIPCCLEVIRVERLPLALLLEAFADLLGGAPRLRREAFGITTMGERLDIAYYKQPPGTTYIGARLAVSTEWRECPAPITGTDQEQGLVALCGWAEGAHRRAHPTKPRLTRKALETAVKQGSSSDLQGH